MRIKQPLIIASNNLAKTQELITCFAYVGYQAISYQQLLTPQKFPAEGTSSYLKNAQAKATFISRLLPDQWVVADDSGMELAADPNGLGVQTARQLIKYTDTEHHLNQRILALVARKSRQVTMKTTLVLQTPQRQFVSHGVFQGTVANEERGRNGASFDLILIPRGDCRTLAQLSDIDKLPKLHRTQAIIDLVRQVEGETGK